MEPEFYLKISTGKSYSNEKSTEAICEWRLNCGNYMMNGSDRQLMCYATVCNQYIPSVYHPYKTFRQFFLALYCRQTPYCFCFKNLDVSRGLGGVSQDEWVPRAHLARGAQRGVPGGLSGPTRPGIHHPALDKHLNFYYSPCFTTYFAIRYVSATRNPGTNQPAAVMCRPLCRGIPFCYQLHDHCPFRVCVTNSCVCILHVTDKSTQFQLLTMGSFLHHWKH